NIGTATLNRTLDIEVHGEGGDDIININANHDTDVRSGCVLNVEVYGEDGNDQFNMRYQGELDGKVQLFASGWFGEDVLDVRMTLDSGSSGVVGGKNNASAELNGDWDNDTLTFHVVKANSNDTAKVNGVIDGGWSPFDHDVGERTSNIV